MRIDADRTSPAGFTMIEILIVVSILAISAMLVVPMVGSRTDLRLAAASRKVSADLQYVQANAITTRQNHFIRFTSNSYEVLLRPSTSLTPAVHPVDRGDFTVLFNSSTNPDLLGVTLDTTTVGTGTVLMFDNLGTPLAYNATTNTSTALTTRVTMTIRCQGRSVQVNVEPYTGEITVSN
jgi:prepilin-type N-terminal cleavage/methylation domain-containing protein